MRHEPEWKTPTLCSRILLSDGQTRYGFANEISAVALYQTMRILHRNSWTTKVTPVQSTSAVLESTTSSLLPYYSSTTQYYSVLQSNTPVSELSWQCRRAMAATARRRLRAVSNGASLRAAAADLRRLRSSNAGWHSFLSSSSYNDLM